MRLMLVVLLSLSGFACDARKTVANPEQLSDVELINRTERVSIVRDINRLPVGDELVISSKTSELKDTASYSALIEKGAAIAALKDSGVANINEQVLPRYLSQAVGKSSWITGETVNNASSYQKVRTIWRNGQLKLVLALVASKQSRGESVFERTDLLVLNSDNIAIDGLTIFYRVHEGLQQAFQTFYVDENQQIWLKGYETDGGVVNLKYSSTHVILPSGRIRKIMSE